MRFIRLLVRVTSQDRIPYENIRHLWQTKSVLEKVKKISGKIRREIAI
jgi:hypothetical protein